MKTDREGKKQAFGFEEKGQLENDLNFPDRKGAWVFLCGEGHMTKEKEKENF